MAYNKRIEYIIRAENRARRSPFLALVNNHQNREDMKLYYVEKKTYFTASNGIEYMEADGGQLPDLYRTELGAILKAEQTINELKTAFELEVEKIGYTNHQSTNAPIWNCRLRSRYRMTRTELSIYKIESKNC